MTRDAARAAREQIRGDLDPVEERKARRKALIDAQASQLTFSEAAIRCHRTKVPSFRNQKHGTDCWILSIATSIRTSAKANERHTFSRLRGFGYRRLDITGLGQKSLPKEPRLETKDEIRQSELLVPHLLQ